MPAAITSQWSRQIKPLPHRLTQHHEEACKTVPPVHDMRREKHQQHSPHQPTGGIGAVAEKVTDYERLLHLFEEPSTEKPAQAAPKIFCR